MQHVSNAGEQQLIAELGAVHSCGLIWSVLAQAAEYVLRHMLGPQTGAGGRTKRHGLQESMEPRGANCIRREPKGAHEFGKKQLRRLRHVLCLGEEGGQPRILERCALQAFGNTHIGRRCV